jgi:hypothetical protein
MYYVHYRNIVTGWNFNPEAELSEDDVDTRKVWQEETRELKGADLNSFIERSTHDIKQAEGFAQSFKDLSSLTQICAAKHGYDQSDKYEDKWAITRQITVNFSKESTQALPAIIARRAMEVHTAAPQDSIIPSSASPASLAFIFHSFGTISLVFFFNVEESKILDHERFESQISNAIDLLFPLYAGVISWVQQCFAISDNQLTFGVPKYLKNDADFKPEDEYTYGEIFVTDNLEVKGELPSWLANPRRLLSITKGQDQFSVWDGESRLLFASLRPLDQISMCDLTDLFKPFLIVSSTWKLLRMAVRVRRASIAYLDSGRLTLPFEAVAASIIFERCRDLADQIRDRLETDEIASFNEQWKHWDGPALELKVADSNTSLLAVVSSGLYGRKYDLFVSYNTKDKDTAREIVERIKGNGYNVFFSEQTIVTGETWLDKIRRSIARSRRFLVLLTKHSIEADSWAVMIETGAAWAMGKEIHAFRKGIDSPKYKGKYKDILGFLSSLQHTPYNDAELDKYVNNFFPPHGDQLDRA